MTNPRYVSCANSDPVPNKLPQLYLCPECGIAIKIWSDETGGKCTSCNRYFKKDILVRIPDISSDMHSSHDSRIRELIEYTLSLGATTAAVISTNNIVVDDDLANKCREPRCENYGLSRSCPPHVSGPKAFRLKLEKYSRAILLKIDIPSEILFSSERRELFQLLHEIASGVERSAVRMGYTNALAYAGGSCKNIFCHEHLECLALSEKGKCRNPQYARPSMSGFGINVAELFKTAGWRMNWASHNADATTTNMANVCGLVLIY